MDGILLNHKNKHNIVVALVIGLYSLSSPHN